MPHPQSSPALLTVKELRVSYPGGHKGFGRRRDHVHAVDGVSFDLGQGESIGIVGESGSGKSTLGRAVLGLAPVSAGQILVEGRDVQQIPHNIRLQFRRILQCIFQDPHSSLSPSHTIEFILKEPFIIHGLLDGTGDRQVDALLDLVGLSANLKTRRPSELSGGQCQRVAIARALALRPKLIICDEPTSSLDVSIQAQIIALLGDLRSRMNLSYLFISHDLAVIQQVADRVMVMFGGRIVEEGNTSMIFRSAGHPYTAALLSAVPIPDPKIERSRKRLALSDDNTDEAPRSGCRFRNRCWLWQELEHPSICGSKDPALAPGSEMSHRSACHFSEHVASTLTSIELRDDREICATPS